MRHTIAAALGLALASALATSATARADTCAAQPVTAKSEPSRFEWTARAKGRANWRNKVRALPTLGPAYANWNNAAETDERCLTGPAGSVCIFTGTPCTK
jgi:hypothetical protein